MWGSGHPDFPNVPRFMDYETDCLGGASKVDTPNFYFKKASPLLVLKWDDLNPLHMTTHALGLVWPHSEFCFQIDRMLIELLYFAQLGLTFLAAYLVF